MSYSNAKIIKHILEGREIFSGKRGRPMLPESQMKRANKVIHLDRQAMYDDLFSNHDRWCNIHNAVISKSGGRWRCQKCHYAGFRIRASKNKNIIKRKIVRQRERHRERMISDIVYRDNYNKRHYESSKRRLLKNPLAKVAYIAGLKRAKYKRRSLEGKAPLTAETLRLFNQTYNFCLKCGSTDNLSIDHVIPLSKGGDSSFGNLQCLCHSCNSKKSATTVDYRVRILVLPIATHNYIETGSI